MIGVDPSDDDTDPADQLVEDVADIIRGTPDMFVAHEANDDEPRLVRSSFFDEND